MKRSEHATVEDSFDTSSRQELGDAVAKEADEPMMEFS